MDFNFRSSGVLEMSRPEWEKMIARQDRRAAIRSIIERVALAVLAAYLLYSSSKDAWK